MKLAHVLLAILILPHCTTTASSATDVEGVVVMVGSAPGARPILEPNGPKSQVEICPGPNQDYIRQFGGTVVKATGEWDKHKVTKERCFRADAFEVTQLVKGRPAFTGTLPKKGTTPFALTTNDGRVMVLEKPSKGVLELSGKKVIMDLLPSNSTTGSGSATEPLWKVVSYMEIPER